MVSKFLQTLAATLALTSLTSASPVSLFRRTGTLVLDSVSPPQQEIIIGQTPSGAYVTYSIDAAKENLIITYNDVADYIYEVVHLYIGTAPPTDNAPGQFPYTSNNGFCTIAPGAQTASCTIPLTLLGSDFCADPKTTYYIASHASHISELVPPATGQTSWGNGPTCIKINPRTLKCAPWAVYSTFEFVCKEEVITPPEGDKECVRGTGFAYPKSQGVAIVELKTIQSNRWGWYFSVPSSHLTSGNTITGDIHVGAGGNVLTNGFIAGTFEIKASGGGVVVSYKLVGNYDLIQTHVYAQCTAPTKAGPGTYGNTNVHDGFEPKDQNFDVVVPGTKLPCLATGGTVYFILHASVGEVVKESATCGVEYGETSA